MSTRQKASDRQQRPNHRPNRPRRQERPPRRDRPGGRHRHGNNDNGSSSTTTNNTPFRLLPEQQACHRSLWQPGMAVWVVQKQDQPTGRETAGTIARILTNSEHHPRGIKVMLASGIVGRVTRRRAAENDNNNGPTTPTTTTTMSNSSLSPGGAGRAFHTTTATTATPATISSASTGSSLNDSHVDDTVLARLVGEMDFEETKARQALVAAGNNLERAIDILLSQSAE